MHARAWGVGVYIIWNVDSIHVSVFLEKIVVADMLLSQA
jgi:hypothetical protein